MAAFRSRLNPRLNKRERLAVASAAVNFTEANYTIAQTEKNEKKTADGAVLQVVGADQIYWTIDGSTPSASVGFIADPRDIIYLETQQQVKNFKAIRVTADTSVEAAFHFGA